MSFIDKIINYKKSPFIQYFCQSHSGNLQSYINTKIIIHSPNISMQQKSQVKYQIVHNKQNPQYKHKHSIKSKNNSVSKSKESHQIILNNIKNQSISKQKANHLMKQHINHNKLNMQRQPLQCKQKFSNIVSKQYKSYESYDSQFNRSQFPIVESESLQAISIIQGLSLIGNSPLFNQQWKQSKNYEYSSKNTEKQSNQYNRPIHNKVHKNKHILSKQQVNRRQSLNNKQEQKANNKKNTYFVSLKKPNQVMKIDQQQQKKQRLQKFKKQLEIKAFMKDKLQQEKLQKRPSQQKQHFYPNDTCKSKSVSQSSVSKQRRLNINFNRNNNQTSIKYLRQNQKYEKQKYHSVEPNTSNQIMKSRYESKRQNHFQQKNQYQLKYNYQTNLSEFNSRSQQKDVRGHYKFNAFRDRQINSNFNQTQHLQFYNKEKQQNLNKTTKNINSNTKSRDNHQQGKIMNRDLKINQLFCLLFARFTNKNDSKKYNSNSLQRQIGVIQLIKTDLNQIITRLQTLVDQNQNKLTKFLGIMLRCLIQKSTSSFFLLTRSIFLQQFENQIQTQSNCPFKHNHSVLIQQLSDFILHSSFLFNRPFRVENKTYQSSKKSAQTLQRAMPKLDTLISSESNNNDNMYVQSPKFCRLADIKIQESYESSPRTVKEQRSLKASKVVQKYQFSPPRKQVIETKDMAIDMDYIKQKFSTLNRQEQYQNFSKTQISPLNYDNLQKQTQRNRARFISNSNGRNDVFLKYIGKQSKQNSFKQLQNRIMKDSLIKEVYTKGKLKNQNNRSYNQLVVLNQQNDKRLEEENLTRKYLRHSNSLQSVHYKYSANQQQQLNHRVSLKGQISLGAKRSDLSRLDNLSSKVDSYLALYKEKISKIGQTYESLRI